MWWFRVDSSNIFTTWDVPLIFILSSTMDWYLEVRIQARDSILFAYWSQRQRPSRSCKDWLQWTTSCTIPAQSMEETSEHGILGRHQSCSKERIEVLSDTIERHHSSWNTPSLLYPESCSDGNWRSHVRERICVTSSSSKDFLETWLDERIGFRSCSTSRRLPTNPTNHGRTVSDRTGRPVVAENTTRSSNQEIDTRFSRDCKSANLEEEEANHDRTGRPVVIGQPISSSSTFNVNQFTFHHLTVPFLRRVILAKVLIGVWLLWSHHPVPSVSASPPRVSGLQKLHSFIAIILFQWWDRLLLGLHADKWNMFLDENQTKGGTKTKWRGLCGPKSVIENQKRAEASVSHLAIPGWWQRYLKVPQMECMGSERTLGSQSVESLSHRLERIELLNDHRDELLLQCAQSRRLLESFLCRTWLVEGDVASFQPFAAARAQGKAYNEAARGQNKHQMEQPFMSVFGKRSRWRGCTSFARSSPRHWTWVVSSRCGTFERPTRKGDQYALWYDTGCAHQIPLSKKMHRASPNWHTSYAKFFCAARASSRKAQHRRRTTSEKFRVNSSSAARKGGI